MISPNIYITVILSGLIASFLLLIFPKINNIGEVLLAALLTTSLVYISINLSGLSITYLANDSHGVIFLVSLIYGLFASATCGLATIAICVGKNKKIFKIISNNFKND